MQSLTVFNFESNKVRTVVEGDEVWFVAKDVLAALGYSGKSDVSSLLSKVPSKWRGHKQIGTPGGSQEASCLSEQGLYFFVCRSDKPKAIPMQEWVSGDVLPSIRRTGEYSLRKDVEWLKAREEGKIARRVETDTIKAFVEYASQQGSKNANMYYMAITKGVYGALFVLENGAKWNGLREKLHPIQLSHLATAEWVAQKYIAEGMRLHMHYKDIYRYAVAKVEEIVMIIGKDAPRVSAVHRLGN